MADDFDLLDDSGGGGGSSFINDLFGDTSKRQRPSTAAAADSSSTAGRKRPTVTFQDTAPKSAASAPAPMAGPSLLDSLFPSKPPGIGRGGGAIGRGGGVDSLAALSSRRTRPESAAPQAPPPSITEPPQPQQASTDWEREQLRREVSSLRYEKGEDAKTITDLRRQLDTSQEEHQRQLATLREEHRLELQALDRRCEREKAELKQEGAQIDAVLAGVRKQEGAFEGVQSRLDAFLHSLRGVQDSIHQLGSREEDVGRVVRLAEEQIAQAMQRLEAERAAFAHKSEAVEGNVRAELNRLMEQYEAEAVQGRRWVEEERQRLHAERMAFQEEQRDILSAIESKQEELDTLKGEFLSKEHDLLIRVVNEKSLLEEQRRDFNRRRNLDVIRLREEAEHLERCLLQVDTARKALERARRDYELKHEQLNELRLILMDYERAYAKEKRSM